MSTILYTDKEFAEQLSRVLVVPASAGSGKTTELTRQLIQLLFSTAIPRSDFGNILAITFTNNAALQMKQRVLSTLKAIHLGTSDEESTLQALLPGSAQTLRSEAGALVDRLLEHYSDFHVQTIDSFLARIFKASALEFGFSPDFAIRLSSDGLIAHAFESALRERDDARGLIPLFGELVDLIVEGGRSDGRFLWNPYEELSREVRLLYRTVVQHAGSVQAEDRSEHIRAAFAQLTAAVLELETTIHAAALSPRDDFEKLADDAREGRLDKLLSRTLHDPPVLTKGIKPADLERRLMKGRPLMERIECLRAEISGHRARQHFLPAAKALAALEGAIEAARRERSEVDIGEVARRLAGFVAKEVIPELFFKLGEEIRHFLIDEFQDTSPVQWRVLQPLIEEVLAGGEGSLFVVGDLKQSIYSFRGADWRILKGLMESKAFPMAHEYLIRSLDHNYRSGGRILAFNREVFHGVVPKVITSGAEDASGLSSYQQKPKLGNEEKGYVETVFLERDDATEPEHEALIEIIKDCLARGYLKRDLAVLTPTNDAVIAVSAWLNEASIEFISHSSLDIRSRKVTAEILALLRFLDSPVDDLSFASVLLGDVVTAFLRQSAAGASVQDVRTFVRETLSGSGPTRPLYALFRERFPDLWSEAFEHLFARVGYLPLYDLVSELCTTLQVFHLIPEEEATVARLLEVAQGFEETGSTTVRDFLQYCDEDSEDADWTMALPKDADAVEIMTVHKAKGLGFRVVITLFYDAQQKTDSLYVKEEADGIVLLRLTKDAEKVKSLAELYKEKHLGEEVDQLNKLYVALTRARDELFVISVTRERAKRPSEFLPAHGYERHGPRPKVQPGTPSEATTAPVLHQREWRLEQPTVFAKISKAEVARGDFVHSVLATIEALGNDVSSQVRDGISRATTSSRETLHSGLVGDPGQYEHMLLRFLEHPEVRPYFIAGPGRSVLVEQEFVDRTGRLFRMDRVVVESDSVAVIDFKTGAQDESYAEQIRNYMSMIRQVYPGRTVRGVLAYVDQLAVHQVGEAPSARP
jgi:ATP-dependent helicase/nuclease subunit A